VSRFVEILLRRPPLVAPPELIGRTFGFVAQSDAEGWTVMAHGADGRRLGRPLKGLSDPAVTSLQARCDRASSDAHLQALADAWVRSCRASVTNAQVLMAFGDAADEAESASA
jgi:hypothetical protein